MKKSRRLRNRSKRFRKNKRFSRKYGGTLDQGIKNKLTEIIAKYDGNPQTKKRNDFEWAKLHIQKKT